MWGPVSPDPDSLPRLERVLIDEIRSQSETPATPTPPGKGSGGGRN